MPLDAVSGNWRLGRATPRCPLCRQPMATVATERDYFRDTWTVRGVCCGRELIHLEVTREMSRSIESSRAADWLMDRVLAQVDAERLYVIEAAHAPHFERL